MKQKVLRLYGPALFTIAFLGASGWITLAGTGFDPTSKGTEFIEIHKLKPPSIK